MNNLIDIKAMGWKSVHMVVPVLQWGFLTCSKTSMVIFTTYMYAHSSGCCMAHTCAYLMVSAVLRPSSRVLNGSMKKLEFGPLGPKVLAPENI